jgi:hypothetical protein
MTAHMRRRPTATLGSFNAEAALNAARGYHSTAMLLERIYRQEMASVRKGATPFTIAILHETMGNYILDNGTNLCMMAP